MAKVQIGSDEMVAKDLPALMEWLFKRVHKREGTHPVEMVYLALLCAECLALIVKEHWQYEEPVDVTIEGLRSLAAELALSIYSDFSFSLN